MDHPPTTDRRIVSRVFFATITVLIVVLLALLIGVIRIARHRTALLEKLMRFEDASASASYEPYHYSPPLQIGGLYERGGLRMHRFSLSGEQPFWADLVANIFDDHPFAQIYEVTILDQRFCDADMPLLDEFAGLRVLCLSLTRVTDDGVWLLTKNNKLTKLELSRTQISDRSLLMLDKLPELRELDIGGTNITKSALEEFRKRHPDCLVFD